MRFGRQLDMRGIIAPSPDADRAVRYLTKYLTKSVADASPTDDPSTEAYERHVDRLHAEVRWLPCSPAVRELAALRRPARPRRPGLQPGRCPLEGARPGTPRPRRTSGPGLAAVVGQDVEAAPCRPGRRRPRSPARRRHPRPRDRTHGRRHHAARTAPPVRVDRHPTRPADLRRRPPRSRSPNGTAGEPSTKQPRPPGRPLSLGTVIRQPSRRPDPGPSATTSLGLPDL